jgi:phage tail-like protein
VTVPASDPANAMRFEVTIDGTELGEFASLEGMAVEYEVKTYAEGGENTYIHQLPGRLKWGNIKLTRPVDGQTVPLGVWFLMISKGLDVVPRQVARIRAFNDSGHEVAEWIFDGVWPVKYTGPSFNVSEGKVATESFEFAHTGLLE